MGESQRGEQVGRWRHGARQVSFALGLFVALTYLYIVVLKPPLHARQLERLREHARASEGTSHPALGLEQHPVLPAHRAAFIPSPLFSPLPATAPGDWADQHIERPQDVPAYISSQPNRVLPSRSVLYLQPTADFDASRAPPLETLRAFMQAYFQMPTRLRPKLRGYSVSMRTHAHTQQPQLHAGELLEVIKGDIPADAYAVLALTTTDLYPDPDWSYVFGMASLKGRAGVYSLARAHQDFSSPGVETPSELLLRRTLHTMLHETGHMFSLPHCAHFQCLLNGANSLEESDAGVLHLCPVCLRKLYHARSFAPRERYLALHELFLANNLREEAAWSLARAGACAEE